MKLVWRSPCSCYRGDVIAGCGAEWALWNSNWTVRAETLCYSPSGVSPAGSQATSGPSTTWYWNNRGIVEGRVGLSYKFGYGV